MSLLASRGTHRGFVPKIGGNSGAGTDNYAGLIDDIRIYNRALSNSEVQQLNVYESQTHELGPRVDLIKAVKPSFSNNLPSVEVSEKFSLHPSVCKATVLLILQR